MKIEQCILDAIAKLEPAFPLLCAIARFHRIHDGLRIQIKLCTTEWQSRLAIDERDLQEHMSRYLELAIREWLLGFERYVCQQEKKRRSQNVTG